MKRYVVAAIAAGMAIGGATAQQPPMDKAPLCAANERLIENALKVIARERNALISEEIETVTERGRQPGVFRPSEIATAWGQINASLLHMQTLGCSPYHRAIDPSVYALEASRCRSARRDAEPCQLSNWVRRDATDSKPN